MRRDPMAAAHDRAARFVWHALKECARAERDYISAVMRQRELDEYDRGRLIEWLEELRDWKIALFEGDDPGDPPAPPFALDE